MYISRKETPKFTVTEIPFEDFIRNDNIRSFLYTAIYSEHNGIKKYFFIKDNQFFKVKMNESDMSKLDKIYKEAQSKKGLFKLGISKVPNLNLSQIMFLYKYIEKEHENSFCSEDLKNDKGEVISELNNYVGNNNGGLPNGGCLPATRRETLKLIRNVIAIESEIRKSKLTDFEAIKYIYDCFKTSTDYWNPRNYYKNMANPMHISNLCYDRRRTANHPFDKFGLIVDKYATCQGLSEGLNELFNYFGIESYTIRNDLHGAVKIMFQDGIEKKQVI